VTRGQLPQRAGSLGLNGGGAAATNLTRKTTIAGYQTAGVKVFNNCNFSAMK